MDNKVIHFEIPSDNPEKTVAFFQDVFGWKFETYGNDYWMAITGDEKNPGINGAIMKRSKPGEGVINSISVESIDDHLKKIEAAGGKKVVPKTAIPNFGWYAYFSDPDGTVHGIFQNDPNSKQV